MAIRIQSISRPGGERGNQGKAAPGDEFHRILAWERERSNRANHPFSLIAIHGMEQFAERPMYVTQVIMPMIQERLRAIDTVGMMNENTIGVILPYTDASGASVVRNEIGRRLDPLLESKKLLVYAYPEAMSS